jgi:hypothetical protein
MHDGFCSICGKKAKLCNSHSIPRFILENISRQGIVGNINKAINLPGASSQNGLNNAKTFTMLCSKCDKEFFADYEEIENWKTLPTDKMLAQIAAKTYLREIYKKYYELGLHKTFFDKFNIKMGNIAEIHELDLRAFIKELNYAEKSINQKRRYYLRWYHKLDYVIPIALQGRIGLYGGFNDEIINQVYELNKDPKEMIICLFPFKNHSIVMMFVKNGDKTYRNFFKQLNKMPLDEQLQTISYIVFTYMEEYLCYPELDLTDKKIIEASGKTDVYKEYLSRKQQILETVKEFSLSKRFDFPNILSDLYAVKSNQ